MNIRFEWDEIKNLSNQEKHGYSFEIATMVFICFHITQLDSRREYGEARFLTMGTLGHYGRVVIVAHTYRKGLIRIISLRKANKREQNIYQKYKDLQNG